MSLEEHIAEHRDAKATLVVRWLEHANTDQRRCRRCWKLIARDDDGAWRAADDADCTAFKDRGLQVPHVPETWTVAHVVHADARERARIEELAGVKRRCSDRTWERVGVLFAARVEVLRGKSPGQPPAPGETR